MSSSADASFQSLTNREDDDKIKNRWLLIDLPNSCLFCFIRLLSGSIKCMNSNDDNKRKVEIHEHD
ncbi:hypothetical protein BHE18_20560 [Rossellomorea aquimaris]|uniref:Uncharacterized protein n=1 Tax=Rossellomorea aquimaris TaxID=189382 RepID=A0A1J6WSK1_9BACI|nr:hypothetical protein BHE18_20560 [Rossellomorea aquimaris]